MTTANASEVPREQGVALIELVIEKVRREGLGLLGGRGLGDPRPLALDVITSLRFPNGERPSPSLARWLAFDAAWLTSLGWFEDVAAPVLLRSPLGAFASREYGAEWEEAFGSLEKEVGGDFYLLPEGSDSRRALYVGRPDSLGEHPIAVTDNDDMPYVALMYPGFDVYMAHLSRLMSLRFETYESLHDHPAYAARLKEHREQNLGGKAGLEFGEDEAKALEPPPWNPGDPVPDGYRVATNPFTKMPVLLRKS